MKIGCMQDMGCVSCVAFLSFCKMQREGLVRLWKRENEWCVRLREICTETDADVRNECSGLLIRRIGGCV